MGAVPSNPAYDKIVRAIADSGNDILIGDDCEVANEATLEPLHQTVAAASLGTGETVGISEKDTWIHACALINDLIDLRSDTARRQRENVVLRGVRGSLCEYLDYLIGACLETSATAI